MTEVILAASGDVLVSTFHILIDASLYLLIGFFVAGLLKGLVPADSVMRHIGRPTFSSVVKASLIGTPLPLCSCSVIPVATSLRQSGASKGATVSFLISTPESGIDSIAISYALLDPLMTVFRPIAAFVTGFTAGVAENIFGRHETLPSPVTTTGDHCDDCHCADASKTTGHPSKMQSVLSGLRYAFTDLLGDVAYYLLIGLFVSALIAVLMPADFFATFSDSEFVVMLTMLAAGIPMYVCASASTPIAAMLILKGLSPGAALVFLLAGPATNLATIGVVHKLLGKRSTVSYLACIAVAALLMGFLLNIIYEQSGLDIRMHMQAGSEWVPDWLKYVSAAILLPLLAGGVAREIRHKYFHKHK